MTTVLAVNEATFEQEVLSAELPVLVDLHADWCAPCKQLAPIVAAVAAELAGKLKVCKIDVDQNPRIAQMFKAQSIPMLVLVHEGRIANQHVGLLDKKGLLEFVKPFLPAAANEVDPKTLAQLLLARRAIPVDIRDGHAFRRFRIPGALHIEIADLATRAAELAPTDGRFRVLYSRTTDEARDEAEKLRQVGVDVGFLTGGFLHWEADGLEVERGN